MFSLRKIIFELSSIPPLIWSSDIAGQLLDFMVNGHTFIPVYHFTKENKFCNFLFVSQQEEALLNSLTTEKQTTKFSSANFKKNVKSKLYHIENSKTRGQTV